MKPHQPSPLWEDPELIEYCLKGDARAWDAIIQKYKRLIYSVVIKYRLPEQDTADIFQAVCIDLYNELDQLRQGEALRGWLARVAANKCFHWKKKLGNRQHEPLDESTPQKDAAVPAWMEEVERDQIVREAVSRLNPRCSEMLRLLFYEDPPRPYDEVARQLQLATGSIGFIRRRCLQKLADELEKLGL